MSRALKAAGAALLVLAGLGDAQAQDPASESVGAPASAPEAASAASSPISPGMRAMLERARKIREIAAAQPAASASDTRAQAERIAPPDQPRSSAEVGAVLDLHRFNRLVARILGAAQPPMDEVRLTVDIDTEGRGHRCEQPPGAPPAPPEVMQGLCAELKRIYFGRKTVAPAWARVPLTLRIE